MAYLDRKWLGFSLLTCVPHANPSVESLHGVVIAPLAPVFPGTRGGSLPSSRLPFEETVLFPV